MDGLMWATPLTHRHCRLSELIAAAEAGEDIIITKRGKAVARLIAEPAPRIPVDLSWLRETTAAMAHQEEDSATLIRRMRDDARY